MAQCGSKATKTSKPSIASGRTFLTDDLDSELPRLLQMQTLVAQAHVEIDRQLAIDLLNYIIVASGSSSSFQMHYGAVALRNNLGQSNPAIPEHY